MTKRGHWTHRLSEYADGELDTRERAACAAHLAECAECADTLEALRAIAAQASLLPQVPPARDLWPGIEDRLEPRVSGTERGVVSLDERRRRRRIGATVPQLAAAAVALIVLTAGGMWLMLPTSAGVDEQLAAGEMIDGEGSGAPQVVFLGAYEPAISELEAAFNETRPDLDPETVRVVDENLAIIDRAITEANQALVDDPSSAFLTSHLAGTMRRKVDLLRRATTIGRTES